MYLCRYLNSTKFIQSNLISYLKITTHKSQHKNHKHNTQCTCTSTMYLHKTHNAITISQTISKIFTLVAYTQLRHNQPQREWQPIYQLDIGAYTTVKPRKNATVMSVIDIVDEDDTDYVRHANVRMTTNQKITSRTRKHLADRGLTRSHLSLNRMAQYGVHEGSAPSTPMG